METFLHVNTIIGIVLAMLAYGIVGICCMPAIMAECRETHKSFWVLCNEHLKPMYEFEKDKRPIVWMLIFIAAFCEAIFLWEFHWCFVGYMIYKAFKEDQQKDTN